MINWIWTAVLLMALWFVMSEKTEPKFLIIGAVSSMLISFVCLRTLTLPGQKTDKLYYVAAMNPVKGIAYFIWLIIQIIKSALYVAKVAVIRMDELDPSIAWFRADYDNPAASALLANSITLTPGTVTIDISDDGIYSVHALSGKLREGLLDGSMQQKVAWVFGEEIHFEIVETYEIPEEQREELPMAGLKKGVYRGKKIS